VPALVDQGTAYPGTTSECPLSVGSLSGLDRNGVRDRPDECPLSAGLRTYFSGWPHPLDSGPNGPRRHDLWMATIGPSDCRT
jgi:hypothetical protein